MSRVLFGLEQLQERGHDAFRLAGVAAAVGDDRVLHRWRVQHFHGAQRLARKLASYSRARKKCDAKVAFDHLLAASMESSSIKPRRLTPAERNAPCVIS